MVVGHKRNIFYLERALARNSLGHAFLFHGPEGVGKRMVVKLLAASLLCEDSADRKRLGGCGDCESCIAVEGETHPDVVFLGSDVRLIPETNTREIGIKNVHELARRLMQTSWQGGRRVAIIDGADRLSHDAQSALLKLLEEPPPKVLFCLISASPGALLPTIVSRAIPLGFSFVSDAEMAKLMPKNISGQERDELLSLAAGRPGVLMEATHDKKKLETLRVSHKRFAEVLESDFAEQFAFSEKESGEDATVRSLFFYLLQSFRRELLGRLDGAADSAAHGIGSTRALLENVLRYATLWESTNANRRMLLDSIFIAANTTKGG